jgi:hypothetical protein
MANLVNWFLNYFLLLFALHVSFLLFFYFWNVVCHPSLMLYYLFFCLCIVFLLSLSSFWALSYGMCLSCTLLSFLCALSLYLGFSPNIVSKIASPICPQHSHVAHLEPLRPVAFSSMHKSSVERHP